MPDAAPPVAVTGAGGRLGRALLAALALDDRRVLAWGRPDYDLDDPAAAARLVARDRPGLVLHAAAWTDVDGCARDPALAMRRNGAAVAELAKACIAHDATLVLVSTNEVFDGRRADGRGYREDDPVAPINPYGRSKLAGEHAATRAYGAAPDRLWIIRTAWLYGPPGNDFPTKILAASVRLPPGEPLRVVADEVGSPTFTPDLARAILALVFGGETRGARDLRRASDPPGARGGTYHLVNAGTASRAAWASRVLERGGRDRRIEPIAQRDWPRPSTPPAWGVLDGAKAAEQGVSLRSWQDALDDYLEVRGEPGVTSAPR
jgi:dTDP-4-dehydrorhamnose reductase